MFFSFLLLLQLRPHFGIEVLLVFVFFYFFIIFLLSDTIIPVSLKRN